MTYTADQIIAIGGSEWRKDDKHRVYLNDWAEWVGLDVGYYKSGNISGATLRDERISNAEAGRLLDAVYKVYFDAADGKVHIQWGQGDPRSMTREDLAAAIFAGIRKAVAGLEVTGVQP